MKNKKIYATYLIVIFVLAIYLWICYQVNYETASQMSFPILLLSAIGMISGLVVMLFIIMLFSWSAAMYFWFNDEE